MFMTLGYAMTSYNTKGQSRRDKIGKLDFIKLYCSVKNTLKRTKREVRDG